MKINAKLQSIQYKDILILTQVYNKYCSALSLASFLICFNPHMKHGIWKQELRFHTEAADQ